MKRVLLGTAAGLSCFALAGSAHATNSPVVFFRTPSGNIGCVYSSGMGPRSLRCDIRSGLKPKPHRPKDCVHLDWGDSYTMSAHGRAILTCHGDTAIDPHAGVIPYGTTWRRGGFECWSRSTGLTCKNASHHGWFLSRQHSYRF